MKRIRYTYAVQQFFVPNTSLPWWGTIRQPDNGLTPLEWFRHLCQTDLGNVYQIIITVKR